MSGGRQALIDPDPPDLVRAPKEKLLFRFGQVLTGIVVVSVVFFCLNWRRFLGLPG